MNTYVFNILYATIDTRKPTYMALVMLTTYIL